MHTHDAFGLWLFSMVDDVKPSINGKQGGVFSHHFSTCMRPFTFPISNPTSHSKSSFYRILSHLYTNTYLLLKPWRRNFRSWSLLSLSVDDGYAVAAIIGFGPAKVMMRRWIVDHRRRMVLLFSLIWSFLGPLILVLLHLFLRFKLKMLNRLWERHKIILSWKPFPFFKIKSDTSNKYNSFLSLLGLNLLLKMIEKITPLQEIRTQENVRESEKKNQFIKKTISIFWRKKI